MSAISNHESMPTMTIGEVMALLRSDFPEVSISKIRFLEGEGLVEPHRAPSGYRRFSPQDVDRLRLILLAQRDHYLPLRVIKDRLEAGELEATLFPEDEPIEPGPQDEVETSSSSDIVDELEAPADIDPGSRFTMRELGRQGGLSLDTVKELVKFGVLEPDAAQRFSGAQVLLCRAFATLRASGIDQRHLRQIKNSASRDASLIGTSVQHLRADERDLAISDLMRAFSEAHRWLVVSELDRQGPTRR